MGILVTCQGILCEDFAQRVGLIGRSERADWYINDVFNDSTTQEVNWTPSATTRVDLAIDYHKHEFESGTASK